MSSPSAVTLLVATRKGAWLYHGDAERKTWRVDGPHFLGHIISHLVLDPRDGRTLLAAAAGSTRPAARTARASGARPARRALSRTT